MEDEQINLIYKLCHLFLHTICIHREKQMPTLDIAVLFLLLTFTLSSGFARRSLMKAQINWLNSQKFILKKHLKNLNV